MAQYIARYHLNDGRSVQEGPVLVFRARNDKQATRLAESYVDAARSKHLGFGGDFWLEELVRFEYKTAKVDIEPLDIKRKPDQKAIKKLKHVRFTPLQEVVLSGLDRKVK